MKAHGLSLLLTACGTFTFGMMACGSDDPAGTPPPPDSGPNADSGTPDGQVPPAQCPPTFSPSALREWDTQFSLAGLTGQDGYEPTVYDFARDSDGSLLVAGYFRWAGGLRVDGLARWRNGTWEPGRTNWNGHNPGSGGFYAVAVGPAGTLALAANTGKRGELDEIWIDKGNGLEVAGRFMGRVRRMVWIDGKLWVAGGMEFDANGPKRLAIWDGVKWSGAPGGDPDNYVYDIVPDKDGHILLAGEFQNIGGVAANLVADWNGTAWSATYQLPAASARALTLARDGSGVLHAGGLFVLDEANKASASFAKWNGTAWEIAGNGVAFTYGTGVVSHILPHDGVLYVTGCFDHVNGGETSTTHIASDGMARWNGSRWTSLDDGKKPVASHWFSSGACGFEPNPDAIWEMPRQRLVVDGTRVLVGGAFGGAGGVPSQSIAAYDGTAWQAVGASGRGISGKILQVTSAPETCAIYGLARASHAGGTKLETSVVRYGDTGWAAAAPPLPANTRCDRIVVGRDQTIALACSEEQGGGQGGRVLVLKHGAWESLVANPLPTILDIAYAPDGTLWIAGGAQKGLFAKWDGGKLITVSADAFDAPVSHLAFAPHQDDAGYDVVVGGFFKHVGALEAQRLARWNGAAWSALGEGVSSAVSALAVTKDGVYVGTQDEGAPLRRTLARWKDQTWTELATPENGLPKPYNETTHTFTSLLALEGGGLIATGYVWPETGGRNAFYFDGTKFSAIAGGAAAISVDGAAVGPNAVYFAGDIAEVGEGANLRASVGVARIPFQ